MENIELSQAEAGMDGGSDQSELEIINQGRLVLGEDFEKYETHYMDIADHVTEKQLAALDEALNSAPENRDMVIRGWFEWLENVHLLQVKHQENLGGKEVVH
jgi:hypothetical protein